MPKAHVESPTLGSIQLAGVLLKIGRYGLIRFIIFFKIYLNFIIILFFVFFTLIRIIISRKQIDNKIVIAYNSISHINFIFLIILICCQLSKDTRNLISITHGLTASIIFFFIGDIYQNRKTRIIFIMQNRLIIIILDIFIIFFIIFSNLRTPPIFSFISELFIIRKIFNKFFFFIFFLFFFF